MPSEKRSKTFMELSEDKREEFKQRYLTGEGILPLAREYAVKRSSAQYYADKYWKEELALKRAELFQEFSKNKKEDFIRMSQSAMTIMRKALEELAKRDQPPSMMEAKRATEILESLDKITRLDDGKPTEISEERPITTIELQKKLSVDPFFQQAEVVEVKELPNDKETN